MNVSRCLSVSIELLLISYILNTSHSVEAPKSLLHVILRRTHLPWRRHLANTGRSCLDLENLPSAHFFKSERCQMIGDVCAPRCLHELCRLHKITRVNDARVKCCKQLLI